MKKWLKIIVVSATVIIVSGVADLEILSLEHILKSLLVCISTNIVISLLERRRR